MLGCFIIKNKQSHLLFSWTSFKDCYNNYQSSFDELFKSGKLKFPLTLLGLDVLG